MRPWTSTLASWRLRGVSWAASGSLRTRRSRTRREAHGPDRSVLQGLIHIAVALEHLRRGRRTGALSQWAKAHRRLVGCGEWYCSIGVGAWLRALAPLFAPAAIPPPPEAWPTPPLGEDLRAQLQNGRA